jgi:predicted DNA-binding transcriptional regulator AlpA
MPLDTGELALEDWSVLNDGRPQVTAKSKLPPIPPALADVALIDGPTCAAANGGSISNWLALVQSGEAPQPVIRQPRFTRWRLSDVRAFLIERAAQTSHDAEVIERAKRASAKATAKRQAAQAGA